MLWWQKLEDPNTFASPVSSVLQSRFDLESYLEYNPENWNIYFVKKWQKLEYNPAKKNLENEKSSGL